MTHIYIDVSALQYAFAIPQEFFVKAYLDKLTSNAGLRIRIRNQQCQTNLNLDPEAQNAM
jgi:hypothetical protein